MNELLKIFSATGGQGDYLGTLESLVAIGLSVLCVAIVAVTYRKTCKSAAYSQSYSQSLVLLAIVTTVVMIVIGSNIARAFSLVGALSIIRFRNAVKETRDVAFIFLTMAIAMSCGTRFYLLAVLSTVIACAVTLMMYAFDFGANRGALNRLLSVQLPTGLAPEAVLEPEFSRLFDSFALVSLANARQGMFWEAVYSVRPLPGISGSQVIDAVSRLNSNLKVTYNYAAQNEDL
ncbi:MAG: DUF4956 domain-containing protein [Planctomycetales bacterium]|nr:DUF4956 domain-containing protein [Planctomycetales bacterium]MCA9169799.1 DUF4956 domain-containing protein [Planctomycetales bacterium]